jgi:hypothetical protein
LTIIGIGAGWVIKLTNWIEQRNEFIRTHGMSDKLRQLSALEVGERMHFGVLRRFSGPVGLEVKESEFAKAKALFPDVEW